MALHTYLPQDRLRALANSPADDPTGALPERAHGAALFADISGFTALTETLSRAQGERRGIELLSQRVNAVYDALVGQVEHWGGSVVGFAGDAITCWFDGRDGAATPRAVACAQALQAAMQGFPGLSLKVGVASGAARRFVVALAPAGRFDVLAGATVARAAMGETLAQASQVWLDQATAALLDVPKGPAREVDSGERFFLLDPAWAPAEPPLAPAPPPLPALAPALLQAWVLPFVYDRETAGEALFVTDLRPATALFLRFGGLDYDRDPQAPAALAGLIATAQGCIEPHGGVLLELTLGDKGSYLYANFGAAQVHEDDPRRALRAALALREACAGSPYALQIGLSCGTLRVGGYGSATRQSFGAIGDEVNAAARLMGIAAPGEILVTGRLRQALGSAFALEARPPMPMKGKAEPIPVFAVLGLNRQRAVRLQEPVPTLPMVGREAELAWLARKLAVAQRGQGQVLGLCAEAGMGKSRLVAEAVRLAHRLGFSAYGGQCAVDGLPTPYGVWQPIWSALFDLDPAWPQRKQLRTVEAQLREHAPEHLEALPLLGRVLGLPWPDNALTAALTPQDSKALLETLLQQCLGSMVREADEDGAGLMLVLEDLHAIDPLSLDLLLRVARAAAAWPLLLVLTYRPVDGGAAGAVGAVGAVCEPPWARLAALHHFDAVTLGGLDAVQAEQLIRAKLAALFPERVGAVPAALIERLTAQAQGNPFYVEELLNYLHDRGLDPREPGAIERIALPASLHGLVLSRIDQLQPGQQRTLKVASVIGRLFSAADLHGYHPAVGEPPHLRQALDELDRLGFTPQAPEEAELSYLFKHLVTLEAGYESMAHGTRVALHAELARYLEARDPTLSHTRAAQLAHHFACAEQHEAARRYLVLAGEQAAAQFANEEALDCYRRALADLPDGDIATHWMLRMRCEALHDLMGRHAARRDGLTQLDAWADRLPEPALGRAEIALRRAKLATDVGDYAESQAQALAALGHLDAADRRSPEAERWRVDALLLAARAQFFQGEAAASRPLLDQALALAQAADYARGEYNTLAQFGLVHWQFGQLDDARALMGQALARIEAAGDLRRQIDLLNNLGVVAKDQGQPAQALVHYAEAEALARRIGDRSGEAMLLNNQGTACLGAGDFAAAGQHAARALALFAELQEPVQQGMSLVTLGESLRELGQFDDALPVAEQALALLRASGARRGEATVLENLGQIHRDQGRGPEALRCLAEALALAQTLGAEALQLSVRQQQARTHAALGDAPAAQAALDEAEAAVQARRDPAALGVQQALRAHVALALGDPDAALRALAPWLEPAPPAPAPLWAQALAVGVLQALDDPRASALATRARATLQARAERIADPEVRARFVAMDAHRPLWPR